MTGTGLDEHDLRLIHALQIAPRVSWAQAARILTTSPATLAARWERMRGEGLAWVTAHPGLVPGNVISMVEVDCTPGARAEVGSALCRDPRVVSVEEPARGQDLMLTVLTADLPGLTAFVLDDLTRMDGVRRQRTHFATEFHRHGGDWRLDALDRRQRAAFESVARAGRPERPAAPPRNAWPLIEALAVDGRRTAAELARLTGRNPATVRRQLARLLASELLVFRCEVAQVDSRWPVMCSWRARVPPTDVERTVAALSTLPELRGCLSTSGEVNMMFGVWVRSLGDVLRLERMLGERMPWVTLAGSEVTLRTRKRVGWLLDDRARATGEVVVPSVLGP